MFNSSVTRSPGSAERSRSGSAFLRLTVRARGIAQITQPLLEGIDVRGPGIGCHTTHAWHQARRLPLGGERRSEEAAGGQTEERPTLHHSLTWPPAGGLRSLQIDNQLEGDISTPLN